MFFGEVPPVPLHPGLVAAAARKGDTRPGHDLHWHTRRSGQEVVGRTRVRASAGHGLGGSHRDGAAVGTFHSLWDNQEGEAHGSHCHCSRGPCRRAAFAGSSTRHPADHPAEGRVRAA